MLLTQRYVLRRASLRQRAHFAFLVRDYVSCHYPGTEQEYGTVLFDQHSSGARHGTTASRAVLAIEADREPVGFLVLSRKADSSVKIGPVVIDPSAKNTGGAMAFALESIATSEMSRSTPYLYCTYPGYNRAVAVLLHRSGWDFPGAVRGLYRDDDEVLAHKVLDPSQSPITLRRNHDLGRRTATHFAKRGGSVKIQLEGADPSTFEPPEVRRVFDLVKNNRVAYALDTVGILVEGAQKLELLGQNRLLVWRP